mgnify:FL=1
MKKHFIVVPSHDGSGYDLFFLPPDDNISAAKALVDQTIKEVKEELGEDIDGESGNYIVDRLIALGFVELESVFAADNYD